MAASPLLNGPFEGNTPNSNLFNFNGRKYGKRNGNELRFVVALVLGFF
jgi:hypothetical protein